MAIAAPDPLEVRLDFQQPNPEFTAYQIAAIDRMAEVFDGTGRKVESQKGNQYA